MIAERSDDYIIIGSRSHPWSFSESDPSQHYVDFKSNPDLIEQSLEDFTPISDTPAASTFYKLIRYLNDKDSKLETSDCALGIVKSSNNEFFGKNKQRSGRLMFLYRNMNFNVKEKYTEWLADATVFHLERADPEDRNAYVAVSLMDTDFVELVPEEKGSTVVLDYFVFGDTEEELLANLERLFIAMLSAFQKLDSEVQ